MTMPRERYFKEGVVNYARCCQKVADLARNVSEVKEESLLRKHLPASLTCSAQFQVLSSS